MTDLDPKPFDRRSFMKTTAAGVGILGVAGCAEDEPDPEPEPDDPVKVSLRQLTNGLIISLLTHDPVKELKPMLVD